MQKILPFLLALLATACDKPAATPPAVPPAQTTAPTPAPPVTEDLGHVAPREDVRAHMREHWGLATVVRDAVIAATLDELPDVAGELADHKAPDALRKFPEPIAAMRDAAGRAQKTGEIRAAAQATADLARACGDCHAAAGASPLLPSEELPPDEDATKAHMLGHDWAARELWAGLVQPSDDRWAKGAAALRGKPLKHGDFFEDWEVTNELLGLDRAVHEMQPRVAAAATRDDRVAIYAELITNCATCHAATSKGPVD